MQSPLQRCSRHMENQICTRRSTEHKTCPDVFVGKRNHVHTEIQIHRGVCVCAHEWTVSAENPPERGWGWGSRLSVHIAKHTCPSRPHAGPQRSPYTHTPHLKTDTDWFPLISGHTDLHTHPHSDTFLHVCAHTCAEPDHPQLLLPSPLLPSFPRKHS